MRKLLITIALLCIAINVSAQTCNANMIKNAPDSRYTNNVDGTVYDKETDLTWMRCSIGQAWKSSDDSCSDTPSTMTWEGALQKVSDQNRNTLLGKSDWRLPNIKELTSLVELACYGPAINETQFPNSASSTYWSSSAYAGNSSDAWIVYFYNGYDNYIGRDYGNRVRLVRGGQ